MGCNDILEHPNPDRYAGQRIFVVQRDEYVYLVSFEAELIFTVACFDRLRILTTELKRLVAARAAVALRLGVAPALAEWRLASALW